MTLYEIFDGAGNFLIKNYDPFRVREGDLEIHWKLFDEDGDIQWGLDLEGFIHENNCAWDSDIVKCYHYDSFSGRTKGNYTTVYGWR